MLNIHQRYCTETFDAKGNLTSFRTVCGDHFNYAYDVMDEIGRGEPERMAMIWRNPEGEEHDLRFSDIARWSNKAANFFLSQGIRRGDRVMLIVRRHYSFWILSLALTKIGAVVVPATFMLKAHDIAYRIQAAELSAVITTTVGTIADEVDLAVEQLGIELPRFLMPEELRRHAEDEGRSGWYFDPASGITIIRYPNPGCETSLIVSYEPFDLIGM